MVEEPVEDGALNVDFPSPSCGLSLEIAQTQACMVVGGPAMFPTQSDLLEHGFLFQGSPLAIIPLEMGFVDDNKFGDGFKNLVVSSGEPDLVCGSELALLALVSPSEDGVVLTPLCTLPPALNLGIVHQIGFLRR